MGSFGSVILRVPDVRRGARYRLTKLFLSLYPQCSMISLLLLGSEQ